MTESYACFCIRQIVDVLYVHCGLDERLAGLVF